MSVSRRERLAADLALGLTCYLLPSPWRVGDVRLIALGRLFLWPGWDSLEDDRRVRVAAFLSLRPDALGEQRSLESVLRLVLAQETSFVVEPSDAAEPFWQRRYLPRPGKPLEQRLDEWLVGLRELRVYRPGIPGVERPGEGEVTLETWSGVGARIPVAHLPDDPRSPVVAEAPARERVRVDVARLSALAARLDASGELSVDYGQTVIDGFLPRLRSDTGKAMPDAIDAGKLSLLVAPTGVGKSVFARLLALDLAQQGVPVALVVPDVASVWKETLQLESATQAAGLALSVAPLHSWRGLPKHLAAHLEHAPNEDPTGMKMLERLGYACLLRAYVTEGRIVYGKEPCEQLHQSRLKGKSRRVACPFALRCGRFSAFEQATVADIVVLNHHTLLAARMPFPVEMMDGGPGPKSVMELVLRRCGAVLIDEVDAFQKVVVDRLTRSVTLSSPQGRISAFYALSAHIDQQRGANQPQEESFQPARDALLNIVRQSEGVAEAVQTGSLEWPRQGMTWREGYDAWLCQKLFADAPGAHERLRALYDARSLRDFPEWEPVRELLSPPGLRPEEELDDVKLRMEEAFDRLALPISSAERTQLINRLLLRGALVSLDRSLANLRRRLPALEQQDISLASQLRDDLLGFLPWLPSPCGALGQRLQGYRLEGGQEDKRVLSSKILTGDPHGAVAELGGLVSEALSGTGRPILALSATGRFIGAPGADVLGTVWAYVEDTARNVTLRSAAVTTRISGISQRRERRRATEALTRELWQTMLKQHLASAKHDPGLRGRCRVLLVTGSYDETRWVGQALRNEAGHRLTVKQVGRDNHEEELGRQEIERFGAEPEPAVLVAPLSVVARGLNILKVDGSGESALSSIFVVVRPLPPTHSAEQMLRHVSYNARLIPPEWQGAMETLEAERRNAWRRVERVKRSHAAFSRMDAELRRELVCDTLVELVQLAGRGRRGGTPVALYLVDEAFHDTAADWRELVRELLQWWESQGALDEMERYHGAFVHALANYAQWGARGWR